MKHIETCMVDGLEFTTWANLWMTFPQQNASCYGMLCAGVFPSVNLSRSQVLYKTLIWHEKLSLQMGTLNLRLNRRRLTKLKLPHPFGPWNLWRPFLGCRNIQSFSQFFWVMELTSIHHRFPQHFPMNTIALEVTIDDARMSCMDQGLGVYRCSYLITQARTEILDRI